MGFFKTRKVEKSYDLIGAFSWFTPGISGLFSVLGWFLIGMVFGSVIVLPIIAAGLPMSYAILVMYPLQFVPVLIYTKLKSGRNTPFDRGYKLDSNHFGSTGGARMAILAAIAMVAASLMLEAVNQVLPEMSEQMKTSMEMLLDGPLLITLLSVSVFAPLFEEWMCRGIILRGLLNYEHKPTDLGDTGRRGLNPALAIVISALFFAVIHGNVWQGVTAFIIGCLFGYVYYRTGSLKLTMLMHCVNNTMSALIAHFGSEDLKDAKSLLEVMPKWEYLLIFIVSAVIVWYFIRTLSSVKTDPETGNNCDIIPSPQDIYRKEQAQSAADTQAE